MHRPSAALSLALAVALSACPGRAPVPPPLDASVVASDAQDAGASAPELPPVQAGRLLLRATSTGAWQLFVDGRPLLGGAPRPLGARGYDEEVESSFGNWRFVRTNQRESRPSQATTRSEGSSLVLELQGADGAQGSLRFTPTDTDVELRARVQAPFAARQTALYFACTSENHFFGFGEQYNDVDHRGRAFPLFVSEQGIGRPARGNSVTGDHTTTYFPVPFFVDPRGWGLAVDTEYRTEVDLCAASPEQFVLAPEQTGEVLLHLYLGPTPAEVLRAWTLLQGRSATPPAWSVQGAWLGTQGGPSVARDALATARANNIPVTAIWSQDWLGRRDFGAGTAGVQYHWSADPTLYPDLAGLVRELRGQGVRFLGYFNPFVVQDLELWGTAVARGYLPLDAQGQPYQFQLSSSAGSCVDLTNPDAVQWFQGYARAALADYGMDGWMHDFGEWLPVDARLHQGDPRAEHNRYPQRWHDAARAELTRARPDGDYVLLTRSGWLREARSAQVVWVGDQECSFSPNDGLPTVIPALTSLGLVGIGFVTEDVAGFSGGPSTRELYQRWTELAAFTPILRTHEGLRGAANWSWNRDADTLAHFGRFARIHALLAPRMLELGREHQATGMPLLRPLWLQYPADAATYRVADEFLLGEDLLVAPVVTEGAVARDVYLPAGTWFDVWDPTRSFTGPATVRVPAPLGRPPVFSSRMRADLAAVR